MNYILHIRPIAHPGMVRMKETAHSYVWWPDMDKAIEQTVRHCSSCQQVCSVPSPTPMMPWMWPGGPWQRAHIDFAEKDKQYYLVVVDAYSKWPEIFLMRSTTAEATVNVLRTPFSKYGLISQIVSDNDPQFRSEELEHFMKMNGVKIVKVSPYHAESNGLAERMVQSFKRSLSASKADAQGSQKALDRVLLYISFIKTCDNWLHACKLIPWKRIKDTVNANKTRLESESNE